MAGAALPEGVYLFQEQGEQDQGDADRAEHVEWGQAQLVDAVLVEGAADGFEGVDVGAGELYRAAGGDVDAHGQRGDGDVVDSDQVEGAGADPFVDVIDGGVGDGGGGCGVDAGGAAGDAAVEDLQAGAEGADGGARDPVGGQVAEVVVDWSALRPSISWLQARTLPT
ncbi:MAG TPA: hypothetical protein VNA11_02425, partial [Pseudonocardia sp.]|nr:hypothetical protein [Pseudonocardia sp.]